MAATTDWAHPQHPALKATTREMSPLALERVQRLTRRNELILRVSGCRIDPYANWVRFPIGPN